MEDQLNNSKKQRRNSDSDMHCPGSPVMSQLVAFEWTSPIRPNAAKVFKLDFTPKQLLNLETNISNSPDVLPQNRKIEMTPQAPVKKCIMKENRGFFKFVNDMKDRDLGNDGESVSSGDTFLTTATGSSLRRSQQKFPVILHMSDGEEEDLFPDKSFEACMSQIPVIPKDPVIPEIRKLSSIATNSGSGSVSSSGKWSIELKDTANDLQNRKQRFPIKTEMSEDEKEDLFPDKSFEMCMSQIPVCSKVKVPDNATTNTGKETPSSEISIPDFDDSSDQLFMDLPIDEIVASSQSNPPSFEEKKGKHFPTIQSSSPNTTKTFVRHRTMPERNCLAIAIHLPRQVQATKPKPFERHTSMPPTNNGALNNFSNFRTSNSVESIDSTSSSASSASTIQSNSQPGVNDKSSYSNSISEEQRKLIAQKKKIAENLRNALRIRQEKQKVQKNKSVTR